MYNEQCRPWFYYLLLAIVAISLIGALGLYFALVPREDGVATSLVFWLAFGFPIVTFIWISRVGCTIKQLRNYFSESC